MDDGVDTEEMASVVGQILGWGENDAGTFLVTLAAAIVGRHPKPDQDEILESLAEQVRSVIEATYVAGHA